MLYLTSDQLRSQYLNFFKEKRHEIIKSASLIPENDASVLFTTAGMHPLVPYLLGQKHPKGNRLCNVQKCVRTGDIDEVGDETHCTFFEMLGNWSLGDYFKKESIEFSYEFLTEVLKIDKSKIAVSVFAGDVDAPKDEISYDKWKSLGLKDEQIFYLPKKNNWWWAGDTGPCGPDTEIFIKMDKSYDECDNTPASDKGPYVEVWNNVFMEYFRDEKGEYSQLKQKNVDTGMGLERTLCILQSVKSVYDTDLFSDVIKQIAKFAAIEYGTEESSTRAMRIIADHLRTATFIMGDEKGVMPSNVDQGYIVRRLIRRAVRYAKIINIEPVLLKDISMMFINKYEHVYPELKEREQLVINELLKEIDKFSKTIENGIKEIEKVLKYVQGDTLNGKTAFRVYDTFGFPLEMTVEIAKEKGLNVDVEAYHNAYKEHQLKSQKGAEQKFKGGLANTGEKTVHLHTATHLLLAALRKHISSDICQRGSNINEERLRFDFNFSRPLTTEELCLLEDTVNRNIQDDIEISFEEMSLKDAKNSGATGIFDDRYGNVVKVYKIGDVSSEICGGPHAKRTSELGHFKIVKEQSSSAGVRRIKAILE